MQDNEVSQETVQTSDEGEAHQGDQSVVVPDNSGMESVEEAMPLVEAVIFASGEPISIDDLERICRVERSLIEGAVARLVERYQDETSGLEMVIVGERYQVRTKGRFADTLRALKEDKPRRLSIAALETLAIVAYRQPIVKSDIERIRGVDATPTIKTLLDRKLIKIAGHQSTVGQPALYGTTEEFLKIFGLKSLGELPTLRDLAELDRDPGETGEAQSAEVLEEAAA